jgi:acetoin:2,6-dichlorophenolindophenol oxidoreductase subunit beta
MPELTFGMAVVEALAEELRRDSNVIVLGEDIRWGGSFGHYRGLFDEFGPERIIDTPIAEAGFVAAGLGAAICGLRPVVSLGFADFCLGAMDELINQIAKIRYMSGGQVNVPIVIRLADGAVNSTAAQHSSSLEAIFCHMPAFKVVSPSTVEDARGLLKSAIRDDGPVIYFEHKLLGRSKGEVPEGEYLTPIGKGKVRRTGQDLTIVTYSMMTPRSLDAANALADEGIQVEVVELRSLQPWDRELVFESVRKTRRALVVYEANRTGGFGAEIAAEIGEQLFEHLVAPVARVAAKDVPIPFSPPMEKFVIPQVEDITSGVKAVLERSVVRG